MWICRVKELGSSNKPPALVSPSEAFLEDAPTEGTPAEASGVHHSNDDLKFLIKVL